MALSKICLFARNHLFRASDPSAQQVRVYMYIFQPNSGVKQIDSLGRKKVVVLLFYVHGKHLRSCRDGQLT